ncbi:hypothetical protein MTO96_017416 [Rhipicephalus appendiculatus]
MIAFTPIFERLTLKADFVGISQDSSARKDGAASFPSQVAKQKDGETTQPAIDISVTDENGNQVRDGATSHEQLQDYQNEWRPYELGSYETMSDGAISQQPGDVKIDVENGDFVYIGDSFHEDMQSMFVEPKKRSILSQLNIKITDGNFIYNANPHHRNVGGFTTDEATVRNGRRANGRRGNNRRRRAERRDGGQE